MQQSTSPPQYGRPSYSQRLFAASRSAGPARAEASRPQSRRGLSVHVVAVQRCPAPPPGPGTAGQPGRREPPAPCPRGSCSSGTCPQTPPGGFRVPAPPAASRGAAARSRSTCQRNAGSESSSQSVRAASERMTGKLSAAAARPLSLSAAVISDLTAAAAIPAVAAPIGGGGGPGGKTGSPLPPPSRTGEARR